MTNRSKVLELFEESIVADDVILIEDDNNDIDEYEWIECMDCVQRKMICILTILIIGTILLVFVCIV